MKNFLSFVCIVLLLLVWLSACSGATPAAPSIPAEMTGVPSEPTQAPPPAAPGGQLEVPQTSAIAEPVPHELVEKARLDLAKRCAIPPDLIGVAEAHVVEWPDASLGCPQPGMAYAAVITPGYWILLEAQGTQYPYHTDQGEQVVLCETAPESSDSHSKNDENVVDGWPNQTRDKDVIVVTPTH